MFYAITTIFQLNLGGDMMYEMSRRKPEPTFLAIQGIFNLLHHLSMIWEELGFSDTVSYAQWGNGQTANDQSQFSVLEGTWDFYNKLNICENNLTTMHIKNKCVCQDQSCQPFRGVHWHLVTFNLSNSPFSALDMLLYKYSTNRISAVWSHFIIA